MNKNAYEIRLNVLQMAHSDMNMKFIEKLNNHRTQDQNGFLVNPSEEVIEGLFSKPAEIIARAEELYKFVEGKNGL
ncbi:MAG: hypothetical protein RL709_982 [Pseudomonadota bacterium]|jgi:hypothetical protein